MGGLVEDKDAILGSLDSVSALANETSDLAVGIRPAFVRDVKGLRKVASNLNKGTRRDRPGPAGPADQADQDRPHRDQRLVLQLLPVPVPGQRPRAGGQTRSRSSTAQHVGKDARCHLVMSTPFRERNPVPIGAISIAVLIALLVVAFKAGDLPLDRRRRHLPRLPSPSPAASSPATRSGSPASASARSTRVELEGDHVESTFKVDTPSKFGTETVAAIKVKTLLGAMFISLEPAGPGQLKEDSTIPVSRTRSPYNVVQAFSGLADRAEKIDIERARRSRSTPWPTLTKDTPAAFQSTLRGLSRLSADRRQPQPADQRPAEEPRHGLRRAGRA